MNSKTCHTNIPRLEDEYPELAKVIKRIGKCYKRRFLIHHWGYKGITMIKGLNFMMNLE